MPKNMKPQSKWNNMFRKVLERMLLAFLVVICIGAFYLAVILAEIPADQQAPGVSSTPAASLTPEQPRQIGSINEINRITDIFPAPVLALQPSDQAAFEGGMVNDLAYQGAFARQVTLTYKLATGETLTLQSIYPSDAFALMPDEGYQLKDNLTGALAGMTAVRMESENAVRLHVRGESALYALSAQRMDEELLSRLSRQAMLIMP